MVLHYVTVLLQHKSLCRERVWREKGSLQLATNLHKKGREGASEGEEKEEKEEEEE